MRSKLFVIGAAIALVSTAIGVSAFTSAQVTRDTNIDIVADDTGLIAIDDTSSGNLIHQDSSGEFHIDLAKGGASGANLNAQFKFGSKSSPRSTMAFNITNQGTGTYTYTIDYTGSNGDTEVDVKFLIYEPGDSTADATVTDKDTSGNDITLKQGETATVVVVIDTDVETGAIDGTLKITV